MIRFHAAWVLPISRPPIRDGWVTVSQRRVIDAGSTKTLSQGSNQADEVDLGPVVIMPGLVNAHTHLELSHLRRLASPSTDFVAWVRRLLSERRRWPDADDPQILRATEEAIEEACAFGTAVVADVSNMLTTFDALARSPLAAVVFYELLGFHADNPTERVAEARRRLASLRSTPRVRPALAPHAPHSVSPGLFQAIRRALDEDPLGRSSIHLSESAEESEFIRTGGGPWRALLTELGVWNPAWVAPGVTSAQFLTDMGFLDDRVLAVHGVQLTHTDIGRLAALGTTLVTCPRSNRLTGVGTPPIEAFYRSNLRVAVGTDSLASSPDLNLFGELAEMRAIAPAIPARKLLASATVEGARALGFEDHYGTIERGRSGRLLAIDVPSGTQDVEEYLVRGVDQSRIHWLDGGLDS